MFVINNKKFFLAKFVITEFHCCLKDITKHKDKIIVCNSGQNFTSCGPYYKHIHRHLSVITDKCL